MRLRDILRALLPRLEESWILPANGRAAEVENISYGDASMMHWEDLRQIHKAQGGIYVIGGRLVSLLVSDTAYYPNEVGSDQIRYAIPVHAGRRIMQAFGSAIREGYGIKVFRKVERGVWEDLGSCKVGSMEIESLPDGREVLFFILKRKPGAKPRHKSG